MAWEKQGGNWLSKMTVAQEGRRIRKGHFGPQMEAKRRDGIEG